jgi:hypothetical protein
MKIKLIITFMLIALMANETIIAQSMTEIDDADYIKGSGTVDFIPLWIKQVAKEQETTFISDSKLFFNSDHSLLTIPGHVAITGDGPYRSGNLSVSGNHSVSGNLSVSGTSVFSDTIQLTNARNYFALTNLAKSTELHFLGKDGEQTINLASFINNGGTYVGIGTDAPTNTLDVAGGITARKLKLTYGAGDFAVLTSDTSGNAMWKAPQHLWSLAENGQDLFYIDGNIGINTPTPESQLHVNGNFKATSGTFSGNLSAINATYTGDVIMQNLEATGGSFSGNLSAINASYTGDVIMQNLEATGGSFSGNLSGNTASFSGDVELSKLTMSSNTFSIESNTVSLFAIEIEDSQNAVVKIGHNNYGNTVNLLVGGQIKAEEVLVVQDVWADHVFSDDYRLRSLSELKAFIETHNHLPGIPDEEEVKEQGVNIAEMNSKLLEKVEELTLYILEQQEQLDVLKQELKRIKDEK